MNPSRRSLIYGAGLLGAALTLPKLAQANDGTEYFYDSLGRLIRLKLSNGTVVVYEYDAAGNRTMVVHGNDSPFNQTLQVTGTGPANLRTIANLAGYAGASNATITFQVGSAVTISGNAGGGIGIDTGTWPSGFTIALTLQVSGKVYGGGGNGGSTGGAAGAGGDALYCRENLTVTVNSGGQIRSGGGGGGNGGNWVATPDGGGDPTYYYGGGGGGGFPNGGGGISGGPGSNGANGTTSGGGSGGAGAAAFGGGVRFTGAGGAGGNAGAAGASGAVATGSEGCGSAICRTKTPPGRIVSLNTTSSRNASANALIAGRRAPRMSQTTLTAAAEADERCCARALPIDRPSPLRLATLEMASACSGSEAAINPTAAWA